MVAPRLVGLGESEADFLGRHVGRVRRAGLRGAQRHCVQGARVPALLAGMLEGSDTDLVAACEELQQNLARTMRQVANPSTASSRSSTRRTRAQGAARLTVLKPDAVVEAARVRVEAGVVNLQVLKELLPEPGALRKALSWPNPRPDSDALMINTDASNAQRGAGTGCGHCADGPTETG